ncbi:transmembrane protein 130 isoform X3 [Mobula birostris]|uniref:transmembrane protein 130 isoform X3 n=1 Tax=Mobula birostris TaxID=1983395 RepID=UPI003B287F16
MEGGRNQNKKAKERGKGRRRFFALFLGSEQRQSHHHRRRGSGGGPADKQGWDATFSPFPRLPLGPAETALHRAPLGGSAEQHPGRPQPGSGVLQTPRLDSVMGTVSLTQTNRSVTSLTNGYELATNTPTKISFILYDPSGYFSTALFHYCWHFGDGERAVTNDSNVFHVYSKAGVYQAHVDIFASLSRTRRKIGIFGATLSLLDPIKAIEIERADDKRASDVHDFQLHVNGSPPLQICWLLSQDCAPVVGRKCRPVRLEHSRNYNLSYSAASPGPYSLSVRAENSVSSFQTCYRVTSWQSGVDQVWFIVLSVTLFTVVLLVTLSTMVRNYRPRKDSVEVADFDFCPSEGKLAQERRAWLGKTSSPCYGSGLSQSHGTSEAHALLRYSGSLLQGYRTWERWSAAPGTGRSPSTSNAHSHSASGNMG